VARAVGTGGPRARPAPTPGRLALHAPARAIAHGIAFFGLPPSVALFYLRAWRLRGRIGDVFSLRAVTKPRELVPLLRAAGDSELVVEIGTGTAWTTIALALARPGRRVVSLDPVRRRRKRRRYLALVDPSVAARVELVHGAGHEVPADIDGVDFLFIDGAHDRDSTLATFQAWRPRLRPGATVAFHDYDNPRWPGVSEAVRDLGLRGRVHHHLFVGDGTPPAGG
jgi:SAM-dependent methyltransferase